MHLHTSHMREVRGDDCSHNCCDVLCAAGRRTYITDDKKDPCLKYHHRHVSNHIKQMNKEAPASLQASAQRTSKAELAAQLRDSIQQGPGQVGSQH